MPTGFPDYQAFEIPVLVISGGTGATSFTSNGVIIGKGSSPLVATAAGSAYQVLRVPAAGGAPAFGPLVFGGDSTKQVSGGPEYIGFQSATSNQVCIANFVGAEANARFLLDLQGNHEWGMGGAADQTTLLAISATGRMAFSGTSGGGLNIVRWTAPGVLEAQPRIGLENNGDGLFFTDGTATADCQIKRVAAQQMDFLGVGAAPTLGIAQSTDSFPRLSLVASDPSIKFGPGTITPVDLLIRTQAGQLNYQGVVGFGVVQSGDTNPRVLLDTTNVRVSFGPGNAAVDAVLRRNAAGSLELVSGGTNQNVILTPSGTGGITLGLVVVAPTAAAGQLLIASSSTAAAWTTPDGARVYHTVDQTATTGVRLTLAFNSERYDNGGLHDTVTNNSRLTALKAGVYSIWGGVRWAGNATGVRSLEIRLNALSTIGSNEATPGGTAWRDQVGCTIFKLAVNDYVELAATQTSGGDLSVVRQADYSPEFAMQWLGP